MIIYGAGLAGLLAGCSFPTATLFESGNESQSTHKAVLRFRSSAVGDAVGIDFRKVRVNKGIWMDGKFVQPDIRTANLYSQKVVGRLADRSIWNIDAAERYIAPEDFIYQLAQRCAGRIEWNHNVTKEQFTSGEQAISTLPMRVVSDFVGATNTPSFSYEPITVARFRVRNADVFQTIYFPSPETKLYRASITGDLLIAEYVGKDVILHPDFFDAFGISTDDCDQIERVSQRYGKIAKIDDHWRKRFIFELSSKHNVFSLGRFGTWRNILLDDVIKDIAVIKRLLNSSDYERSHHSANA